MSWNATKENFNFATSRESIFSTAESMEYSGFTNSINNLSPNTSTDLPSINETLSCEIWKEPARIILEIISLATLLLNILASIVIFDVDTNVRGRHVAFLFGCVRILNVLDIAQCIIVLFGPILIPTDCHPNGNICNFLGFLFICTALFSPLVVIVMAIDRATAVYCHVMYKANPFIKLKYSFLATLMLMNGIYFFLPCVTDFSAYVVVPWVSLCFIEWGMQYRLYDLILAFYTFLLTLLLIAANIAILIKVRLRKIQIKKMTRLSSTSSYKDPLKTNRNESKLPLSKHYEMRKRHRSAEDLVDVSANEPSSVMTPSPVLRRKKQQKSRPPPLNFQTIPDRGIGDDILDRELPSLSPLLRDSNCVVTSSSVRKRTKVTNSRNKRRPVSLFNPLTKESFSHGLITSLISDSPRESCSSPLAAANNHQKNGIENSSVKRINRVQSADNLLNSSSRPPPPTPNQFSFSKPLLRQVLDYPANRPKDGGSVSDSARSDEEMKIIGQLFCLENGAAARDFKFFIDASEFITLLFARLNLGHIHLIEELPRNQSSASSFFSVATARNTSIRSTGKTRKIRKNVSRITKMTVTICLVFVLLYVPFLIRKLIQLLPNDYTYVHPAVEIITLFGPFLSPLCNPIIYVFLNPHYKKNFDRLHKKLQQRIMGCFFKDETMAVTIKPRKVTKSSTNKISSPSLFNQSEMAEDVFLPETSCCTGRKTADAKKKKRLRLKYLKQTKMRANRMDSEAL